MDTLKIFTKNNCFYLMSEITDFDNIRIANKKGIKTFNSVAERTWKISFQDIAEILSPNQEDRAMIYYGDSDQQISAYDFKIESGPILNITQEDQTIFFYISMDNKLRFMWHQVPSATIYRDSIKLHNIYSNSNNSSNIHLNIEIISNYFPLKNTTLIIKNRKEGYQVSVQTAKLYYHSMETNKFNNKAEFCFSPTKIFPFLHPNFQYDDFDTSVFDFYLSIEIAQFELTAYNFRVPFYSSKEADETWCRFQEENMMVIKWYPTPYGNLSTRIGVIDKALFKYYLEAKNLEPVPNVVLITEYPHKAQDNGLQFFKYMMEKQTKFTPYYIVSKNSKDLKNLERYKENIIFYKSKEHIQLFFKANYLLHTHTPNYALPFISQETEKRRKQLKKIFLQHGIIGVRDLEYIYGRKSNPELYDKIVVSSARELAIVRDELFYPEDDIALTGLARFDTLLKGNNPFKSFLLRKKILIMPTWRKGQESLSNEEFMKTDFYKKFQELITDVRLKYLVTNKNCQINFYLHNNFQKYSDLFNSDFVNIIPAGEYTVQELLKNHGVLITDYSSVGLDFAIQFRPVIYYQFDEGLSEMRTEEASFLPGPIVNSKEELLSIIERKTTSNKMDKKYKSIVTRDLYTYRDKHACKRIFDVLDNF